jgi:predicted SnoaL-like aldol condensation-catalyzing enzyme
MEPEVWEMEPAEPPRGHLSAHDGLDDLPELDSVLPQVWCSGLAAAQAVVFHHRWPLSADDWDAHVTFFLSHGYRVIAHDRRGHDRSTQTDTGNDTDHYAADVAARARRDRLDDLSVRPDPRGIPTIRRSRQPTSEPTQSEKDRRPSMSKTTPEQNKALVLEAFGTLFNKRDYAAAERYWSDRYIQHSAHIAPGRDGLFNLIRTLPDTLKYENQLMVAEDDYVIAHGRFSGTGRPAAWVAADIVRIEDGKLAEHWDVLQDEATKAQSVSRLPMFGDRFPD